MYLMFFGSIFNKLCAQERTLSQKRAQNVFVEIGGQGLLFTANYDTRFFNKRSGLGGRAGIGYMSIDNNNVTTFPISINYLLGKGKSFFEIGLGATFLASNNGGTSILFDHGSEGAALGTMSFSYRLQPEVRGFSFRAGLTPIFNERDFMPYFGGISLGYSF